MRMPATDSAAGFSCSVDLQWDVTVLPAFFRHRLGADLGKRGRRRDGLAIDGQVHDSRLTGGYRLLERRRKILGALDGDTEAAEGARIGGKIRVAQLGRRNTARIFALLVHADGAVHAVRS